MTFITFETKYTNIFDDIKKENQTPYQKFAKEYMYLNKRKLKGYHNSEINRIIEKKWNTMSSILKYKYTDIYF
jgi:spore coat protein CotF